MASIHKVQRKSGPRYLVYYTAPPSAKYKTRQRTKTFRRRKDAELFIAQITTDAARGRYIDQNAGNALVEDVWEEYIAAKKVRCTAKYIGNLRTTWNTHVAGAFGKFRLNELTRANIQSFVADLSETRSATTVLRAMDVLRGICEIAVRDNRIGGNPCHGVELPRRERKTDRTYLTPRQLYDLAAASGRWRQLVLTLGLTGIRAGEARALRVRDIDFKKHRLRIARSTTRVNDEWVTKDTKTHALRTVPFPDCLTPELGAACAGKRADDLVFTRPDGMPFDEQSVGRHVKNVDGKYWLWAALQGARLPDMTMHDLRHTAASIAISAGANVKAVQRMLGHKSAAMTLDVYGDLFDSDLDEVRDRIDQIVRRDVV